MMPRHDPSLTAMRRRSRAWLAAVLPALVLRALIPFGFMPVASAAGLAMELCPGAAAMASGGHHHQGNAPATDSAHALCIFAAGAAPALVPVVLDSPLAGSCTATISAARGSTLQLPSIQRAQAARAPPSSV